MSNTSTHSRQPGSSRRRRSRGGKNRNKQQDRRHGGQHEGRASGRAEEFRPQGPRPPRGRQAPPLNWWQKLLKAIGLYKEPAPPSRRPEAPLAKTAERAPKSNTRNARSQDGEGGRKGQEEMPAKRAPRGGDRASVESPRVYVGNLSYEVTEQDLQELFKGIGGVRNVEIVYNRSTHRSKGYGFVEMLHKDEAIRAVEVLHDQFFMGRKLTVSGAKSKGQDEREDKAEEPDTTSRKVSLAPLPAAADTTPDDEPVIQTIVESVAEAPKQEQPTRSEVA
ncbi:MAG: hypothetical protein MUF04_11130 [Akkermansiaceae bacterium]|nr:hypothetical protein [Akkermansiaceae bacterium]